MDSSNSLGSSPEPVEQKARSCLACYGRKVKCDRGNPCANCGKAKIQCVYPNDTKIPPSLKNSRRMLADAIERLDRLERLVKSIVTVDSSESRSGSRERSLKRRAGQDEELYRKRFRVSEPIRSANQGSWEILLGDSNRSGKYVNNPILANVFEDEEQTTGLQELSLMNQDPQLGARVRLTCRLFATTSTEQATESMLDLHPSPTAALKLWSIYVKNVDPLMKILHVPSTQSAMIEAITELDKVHPNMHALMFAIYLASISSQSYEQVLQTFGDDRRKLLGRFEQGLDLALAKADLLGCPNLRTLQALTIYLTCMRVHTLGHFRYTLIGIAIRIAESIGLHRDGNAFKLSMFENEMRLRLWWHLCVLDSRASEDHGCSPSVYDSSKLRLPLNINDVELHHDMTQLPQEPKAWTDTSFFLVQIESIDMMRSVLSPPHETNQEGFYQTLELKRKEIESRSSCIMGRYFHDNGLKKSSYHTALNHHKIACAKLRFILQIQQQKYQFYQERRQKKPRHTTSSTLVNDNVSFKAACDVVELSYELETSRTADEHKWFFKMYTQWYALAYVLRGICIRPDRPCVEHIWDIVDKLFESLSGPGRTDTESGIVNGTGSIWRTLTLLREKALHSVTDNRGSISMGKETSRGDAEVSKRSSLQEPIVSVPEYTHYEFGSEIDLSMEDLINWPGWPTSLLPDVDINI